MALGPCPVRAMRPGKVSRMRFAAGIACSLLVIPAFAGMTASIQTAMGTLNRSHGAAPVTSTRSARPTSASGMA